MFLTCFYYFYYFNYFLLHLLLLLQGSHIRVSVDGKLCANIGRGLQPQWLSHHEMECVVDEGVGMNLDISGKPLLLLHSYYSYYTKTLKTHLFFFSTVEISNQTSVPNELFHYSPASIFAIRPNHGTLNGGETITLVGENFGTPMGMEWAIAKSTTEEVRPFETRESAKQNACLQILQYCEQFATYIYFLLTFFSTAGIVTF